MTGSANGRLQRSDSEMRFPCHVNLFQKCVSDLLGGHPILVRERAAVSRCFRCIVGKVRLFDDDQAPGAAQDRRRAVLEASIAIAIGKTALRIDIRADRLLVSHGSSRRHVGELPPDGGGNTDTDRAGKKDWNEQ